MGLWGAAPLVMAALLSGGAGVHVTAVSPVIATSTPSPSPSPSASPSASVGLPGAGAPVPVLRQIGPASWQTTVLLTDTGPACLQAAKAHYWLATTTPYLALRGSAMMPRQITDGGFSGSSCQVQVTFKTLSQTPQTATLVIDQPGMSQTVALTVSRNVTLTDYLLIPFLVGLGITLLSLLFSVVLVRRNDQSVTPGSHGLRHLLERPILGSGAWTANDSWATNITTGLVVVGAVLSAVTASSSLFPGIALDEFSLVAIAAGFFVAAAPVVFGILYSSMTTRQPGLVADATVAVPWVRAAIISIPSGASITMAGDTAMQDDSGGWATVRGGGTYQVPPGGQIQVLAGVQDLAQACTRAAGPAVADALAKVIAHASVEAAAQALADPDELPLVRQAVQRVAEHTTARAGIDAQLADELTQRIRPAVAEAVSHPVILFAFFRETVTLAGATHQAISVAAPIDDADVEAGVWAGIQAARLAAAPGAGPAGVSAGMLALRLAIERAAVYVVTQPTILDGSQSAGAIRRRIATAVQRGSVRAVVKNLVQDVMHAPGPGYPLPPEMEREATRAITRALKHAVVALLRVQEAQAQAAQDQTAAAAPGQGSDTLAYSGGSDIGVLPGSILQLTATAGTWTVQAGDVLAQPASLPVAAPAPGPVPPGVQRVQIVPPAPPGSSDAPLAQPVLIEPAGGAKVTVTGTADVSLPKGAVISAPRRKPYPLLRQRQLLAPQGTNIIVANLKILLAVNLCTMFGIGAELGIAGVLALLSDATLVWQGLIVAALAVVAVLVIFYAATAARAMADPQPGSSLSAQTGTSFTL